MNEEHRKRLEARGWRVGTAADFLSLALDEVVYIEICLALAAGLRGTRKELGLTQTEVAKRIGSSQSRVAKMEAGDPSISIDRLVRAHLALGASPRTLAEVIRVV